MISKWIRVTEGPATTYPLQLLVGKADTVLHSYFICHCALLAQDCDALQFYTVLDHAGAEFAHRGGCALDSRPSADAAAPANDRVQYAGVVLDLGEDIRLC